MVSTTADNINEKEGINNYS